MTKKSFIIFLLFSVILVLLNIFIFYPIFTSNNITISFAVHPFNICKKHPQFWYYFKIIYTIFLITSSCSLSYILIKYFLHLNANKIIPDNKNDPTNLNLKIGYSKLQSRDIFLPEKSLYQNILITGTIGSGKTSSAIYPFSEQLIKYNSNNFKNKLGILCLDVKGNFYKQIKFYAKKFNRLKDLIIISLNSNETYNPLDKPNLNPLVLANRLKTILSLFSPNNSDSFWLDKVEQVICEAIKLCRLYNNNYVNFIELHKLINDKSYYFEKVKLLRNMFLVNKFSNIELYNLTSAITFFENEFFKLDERTISAITFFENEFFKLDERTISILKSEITRITLPFVSDYRISKVFSPSKNNITFSGFKDIIKSGKIVVLSMNISEFSVLSKIIATYMKLDFQSEVMSNLNSNNSRSVAFICDEYQEYITSSDANFFSESREAKCINIVSTQSYSSLLNTIKDESALKVILQNLVNKLWFRTDDIFTIENAQKQIGKEDKKKISKTIAFICDEYQEYITSSDANFFSESREAKCINIVSTQSYSSLLNTIKDESALKVILQNLVNKLWFRTDDIFTIENAQKQIGKEDKKKISKTISENAQESNYNYLIQKFKSKNSNISESINTYFQYDYVYDSNFFTQQLETFSCLAFLSNGITTIPPQKIDMYPYFK